MKQYLDLVKDILENGEEREDRTGTGTISVFGRQLRFNLQDGFPLLTTKKLFFRGIVEELLWFISGALNIEDLSKKDVHIWDAWKDKPGKVPYSNWRNWWGFDQLDWAIREIQDNPTSRRILVNSWDFNEVTTEDELVLPPCHFCFQFYVRSGKYLDLHLNLRSNDIFLGAPWNIASYSLLDMMIAQVCELQPGELIYTIGDAHIYKDHINQVKEQLQRKPRVLPRIKLNPERKTIDDFEVSDFDLLGYTPWPSLKGNLSV